MRVTSTQHATWMGLLAIPVLFVLVWAIFDSLLGSPWGLILAIFAGVILPALIFVVLALEARDERRELDELSRGYRPTRSSPTRPAATRAHQAGTCPAGADCPHQLDADA